MPIERLVVSDFRPFNFATGVNKCTNAKRSQIPGPKEEKMFCHRKIDDVNKLTVHGAAEPFKADGEKQKRANEIYNRKSNTHTVLLEKQAATLSPSRFQQTSNMPPLPR